MLFAEQLRKSREESHLSQKALASRLNVSPSTVKRWEAGTTNPYPYHRLLLQRVFPAAHFEEEENKAEAPPLQQRGKSMEDSTYFVQDRFHESEMQRLQIQDRIITAGMGGMLPEQPDLTCFHRVLDIGCGTGGWLIRLAQTLSELVRIVGIDISPRMIAFARQQAGHTSVEFQVMDALRLLEFPDSSFDLVNARLAESFIRVWEWPRVLKEIQRILRPGGTLRIVSTYHITTNSPALHTLWQFGAGCANAAGYTPNMEQDGLTKHLIHLLNAHQFPDVQKRETIITYKHGTPECTAFAEDMERIFPNALPFWHKHIKVPENFDEIYQRMLREMQHADFVAEWPFATIWGVK